MLLALLLAAAQLPDFSGYVVDRAGLLDAGSVAHLKQVASQLDHAGLAQVAVCTVPESAMDDDSLEDYAVALFKKWGLGHGTKRDDGVLVLFVPGKPGHRQIRIEIHLHRRGNAGARCSPVLHEAWSGEKQMILR